MADVDRSDEAIPVANRRETLFGIVLSSGFIAIIAIALRLYARFKLAKRPGWDDALAVLSLLSVITGSIFLCLASFSGLGQHFDTLSAAQGRTYLFRFYVANATYATSTTLIKLSLLCQYHRIFRQGWMRITIRTLLASCIFWGLLSCFMAWLPCFPLSAYWDWSKTDATCYAFGTKREARFVSTYVSHAAFNMVLDFIILVLPAPIILRRSMTKREKLAALGLGTMGTFVIAICAWRLAEIVHHRAAYAPYPDFSWWAPPMVILAAVEVNIAILAVSCPVFWPVLEQQFLGIVVEREVRITSHHQNTGAGFGSLDSADVDGKSESGSEAALAVEVDGVSGKMGTKGAYYTEELALEPMGLGQNDVMIRGRRDSPSSWMER